MNRQIFKLSTLGLIVAAMAVAPIQTSAADNKPATENPAPAKPKPLPFRGKLTAVDKVKMTITVGERVFQITSTTKISKEGKPAIMADGVVGENVTGAYLKGDDGKLTAITINYGVKPEAQPENKVKEKAADTPPM